MLEVVHQLLADPSKASKTAQEYLCLTLLKASQASEECVAQIVRAHLLPVLIEQARQSNIQASRASLLALSHVLSSSLAIKRKAISCGILHVLKLLLEDSQRIVLLAVCEVLVTLTSPITKSSKDTSHDDASANHLWFQSSILQAVLDVDILPKLCSTMGAREFDIQKKCAYTIGNMALYCARDQRELLIQAGVTGSMFKFMSTPAGFNHDFKKFATVCITTTVLSTQTQRLLKILVEQQSITALCGLLAVDDSRCLALLLESLQLLLEAESQGKGVGGVQQGFKSIVPTNAQQRVRELRKHGDDRVSQLSKSLVVRELE